MTAFHGIYGAPPTGLFTISANAVQLSPLLPGGESLEDVQLASLTIVAPPGTLERRYALARGLLALLPGAPITALAPKHKGGSRIRSELQAFGCHVNEEARKHFRICKSVRPENLLGLDEALAGGMPRLVPAMGLWSQPGIFSWDRIDPGSALLVAHLPALKGKGADLGCGIGYLARAVLHSPDVTHMTLIDIDRRAIEAARRNVEQARTELRWADARSVACMPTGLDFIVMNPPFHDGGTEDKALGLEFIRAAHAALRTGGQCWLVANRHLPYESVIKPLFARAALHAETDGFKIYEAVK